MTILQAFMTYTVTAALYFSSYIDNNGRMSRFCMATYFAGRLESAIAVTSTLQRLHVHIPNCLISFSALSSTSACVRLKQTKLS